MALKSYCLMLVAVVSILLCGCGGRGSAQSSLAGECAQKITEVMPCLGFASGKESTPQKKCCDSTMQMRKSNPACLCFIIQQIHNGSNPGLRSMNIQETRLLQLPSACKIANANISDCPKLLKLPPNSPDAAIFNNVSTTISPTTGGTTTSSPTTTTSHGFKHEAPNMFLGSIMDSILFFLVFSLTGLGA